MDACDLAVCFAFVILSIPWPHQALVLKMQQSAHAERGVKVKGAQSDKAWGGKMEGRAIW